MPLIEIVKVEGRIKLKGPNMHFIVYMLNKFRFTELEKRRKVLATYILGIC